MQQSHGLLAIARLLVSIFYSEGKHTRQTFVVVSVSDVIVMQQLRLGVPIIKSQCISYQKHRHSYTKICQLNSENSKTVTAKVTICVVVYKEFKHIITVDARHVSDYRRTSFTPTLIFHLLS